MMVSPVVGYVCIVVVPREAVHGVVCFLTFMYLIVCHVVNASGGAWSEGNIDFTGSQMVLTLKIIACAFNYDDGGLDEASLTPHQKQTRLVECPSVLMYMAYILDPVTVLIGPFLEFREFSEFMLRQGAWLKEVKQPAFLLPALGSLVYTTVLAFLHVVIAGYFPIRALGSDEFWQYTVAYKLVTLYMVAFQTRLKYYFCWTLTHTGLKCSGLAFSGADKPIGKQWERGLNVRPLGVEFARSSVEFPLHWNICTGNWLRHYVYDRVTPTGQKPGLYSLIVTQTVSGVWHGLYAGYWMFFVSSALMLHGSRYLYRMISAAPVNIRPVLHLFHGLLSALQLNYLAVSFMVLGFHETIAVWWSVGFVGHVVMLALALMRCVRSSMFGLKSCKCS
jgi:lysophospholipid acyltransferase